MFLCLWIILLQHDFQLNDGVRFARSKANVLVQHQQGLQFL